MMSSSMRSSPWDHMIHSISRSWASEPVHTRQPSFSSPTRLARGTSTSSKNTSLKSGGRPVMSANGRRSRPGVSVSMISAEMPLCLGASGSVRTNASSTSASWAPEVQTFWPLTMKRSPSTTARVDSPARSLPAPGSLMPSAAVFSARMIGTAQVCFCSSVPKVMIDALTMPRPCGLKLWVTRRRPSSSQHTACS